MNVLTIGSYDWNDEFHMKGSVHTLPDVGGRPIQVGSRSSYSSPGPLRFGSAVKPEFVAPGQWYSAAAPLNINPYWGRDSTGLYQRHNGTSAATPYTAGIVALLLQAQPKASWGDVRKALIDSVTKDQTTGTCPNPEWGNGKLDYAAVERAVKRLKP
jgi:subtilisin family serine protease